MKRLSSLLGIFLAFFVITTSAQVVITPARGLTGSNGAGAPGGGANSIQFNSAGTFGGFGTWSGTLLTIPGAGFFDTTIDIGTAGVRLGHDSDGALTILGLGNGFDENLIINLDDTTNTIVLSSSTAAEALVWEGSSATTAEVEFTVQDNYAEVGVLSGISVDDSVLIYASSNDSYIAVQASATILIDLQTTTSQSLVRILHDTKSYLEMGPVTFANLGTPVNGTIAYCSNCTLASPCASGGTGALAKRLNTTWVCN